MIITHGNVKRKSRIPPQYVKRGEISRTVSADQIFEYTVPPDRDLQLDSIVIVGDPTGGEFVSDIHLSVRSVNTPDADEVLLDHSNRGIAGQLITLIHHPPNCYIPRNTVIRGHVIYSAGVASKVTEFYLTGWLVPPYDLPL